MENIIETPYADLTPDVILNAVESTGFHCSGVLSALNSYENRVYQVGLEEASPIVVKFYRPNRWSDEAILEEHYFAAELQALEVPVVAPLEVNQQTLHCFAGFRFAMFPRISGRALELDNLEQLEQMGRFIGRIHAVGACGGFQHRIQLNAETYGAIPFQFLLENDFIPPELKHNFMAIMETILEAVRAQFAEALHHDIPMIRLHGDCHAGNVLCHDGVFHIVDLDDCLTGFAIQDIWMMLSGSEADTKLQLKHILDGYYEFHEINLRELHLIESLRTLRMIHYAGWLAKRWNDPAFPVSFPWFNTPKYWETLLMNLREQAELLLIGRLG